MNIKSTGFSIEKVCYFHLLFFFFFFAASSLWVYWSHENNESLFPGMFSKFSKAEHMQPLTSKVLWISGMFSLVSMHHPMLFSTKAEIYFLCCKKQASREIFFLTWSIPWLGRKEVFRITISNMHRSDLNGARSLGQMGSAASRKMSKGRKQKW